MLGFCEYAVEGHQGLRSQVDDACIQVVLRIDIWLLRVHSLNIFIVLEVFWLFYGIIAHL